MQIPGPVPGFRLSRSKGRTLKRLHLGVRVENSMRDWCGWGGPLPTHQRPRQLLCPLSIHPALPCPCQAPGLLGALEPAEQCLKVPASQVLPPGERGPVCIPTDGQEHHDPLTARRKG